MVQMELGFTKPYYVFKLIQEQTQLEKRLISLTEFRADVEYKKLSLIEQNALTDQHYFMTGYLSVLTKRIERAIKKEDQKD